MSASIKALWSVDPIRATVADRSCDHHNNQDPNDTKHALPAYSLRGSDRSI
jgi:hypothetical protein